MIFDKLIQEKRDTSVNVNDWNNIYSFENGYDVTPVSKQLKESTYYSCIRIISESIAKCPLQVKQETDKGEIEATDHYLYDLLNLRPNDYMNAVTVIKTFVTLGKHEGISGLYIDRQGSKVIGLYPIKIVGIIVDDIGLIKSVKNNKILYDWQGVNGETGSSFDADIIVLKDFTLDGINTRATRTILRESLDTSLKSQSYLNSLFGNGLTNKIVVQLTSDIKEEKEISKIQAKFNRIYSNNNRIFTVPAGYNVSPLNLSLSDAQFTELRLMSKKDIAGAMGVPLTFLGEIKENAKSEGHDMLNFLVNTLQVLFTAIEQEMNWKLLTSAERTKGYKIKFDMNVLLKMDKATEATVITTYVKNGVYSLNYAKKLLGLPLLGKDVTTFPSGQVTLEQMMNGNTSYTNNPPPITPQQQKEGV
ncbi:phage portal protein, HK97 family [Clostridium acidisoli DSM 12555]|uniref:Phage portal protein, HK97 family n=1 Tax=Clostridium acidisoli DSM 12555 TaxID=1121291 RepID=A0A1W1X5Y2_9CLOT|nr:phage portal protein [Clostridium acidisoli]SMC19336.1 phage portal protein, HK97 family [Clostridium acidisoli DSM 12555]